MNILRVSIVSDLSENKIKENINFLLVVDIFPEIFKAFYQGGAESGPCNDWSPPRPPLAASRRLFSCMSGFFRFFVPRCAATQSDRRKTLKL